MGNSHLIPDMMSELQATCYDLLPACIVSTSWPTTPVPPSLTLAAFATAGYVKDGPTLTYCVQDAHPVTLVGGDGNFWVALSQDSFTTYASWNRVPGSHYLWRASATRPPDVDGFLVAISVTVSGGNITAVSPASGVTRAEALRSLSGLGTMATQNASAVAITGGSATFTSPVLATKGVQADHNPGDNSIGFYGLQNAGGANRWNLWCPGTAPNGMLGPFVLGTAVTKPNTRQTIWFEHAGISGILLQPTDNDTGTASPLGFFNVGGGLIGNIATTATTTAYNTASDARLKEAITALAGALDVVRALRPVAFRWQADGSPGHGFLAHELMQVVPEAVSGLPDAVNDDGSIRPQQVDHSKLIPWLTAALQETLAQAEALAARVTTLEEALGL